MILTKEQHEEMVRKSVEQTQTIIREFPDNAYAEVLAEIIGEGIDKIVDCSKTFQKFLNAKRSFIRNMSLMGKRLY